MNKTRPVPTPRSPGGSRRASYAHTNNDITLTNGSDGVAIVADGEALLDESSVDTTPQQRRPQPKPKPKPKPSPRKPRPDSMPLPPPPPPDEEEEAIGGEGSGSSSSSSSSYSRPESFSYDLSVLPPPPLPPPEILVEEEEEGQKEGEEEEEDQVMGQQVMDEQVEALASESGSREGNVQEESSVAVAPSSESALETPSEEVTTDLIAASTGVGNDEVNIDSTAITAAAAADVGAAGAYEMAKEQDRKDISQQLPHKPEGKPPPLPPMIADTNRNPNPISVEVSEDVVEGEKAAGENHGTAAKTAVAAVLSTSQATTTTNFGETEEEEEEAQVIARDKKSSNKQTLASPARQHVRLSIPPPPPSEYEEEEEEKEEETRSPPPPPQQQQQLSSSSSSSSSSQEANRSSTAALASMMAGKIPMGVLAGGRPPSGLLHPVSSAYGNNDSPPASAPRQHEGGGGGGVESSLSSPRASSPRTRPKLSAKGKAKPPAPSPSSPASALLPPQQHLLLQSAMASELAGVLQSGERQRNSDTKMPLSLSSSSPSISKAAGAAAGGSGKPEYFSESDSGGEEEEEEEGNHMPEAWSAPMPDDLSEDEMEHVRRLSQSEPTPSPVSPSATTSKPSLHMPPMPTVDARITQGNENGAMADTFAVTVSDETAVVAAGDSGGGGADAGIGSGDAAAAAAADAAKGLRSSAHFVPPPMSQMGELLCEGELVKVKDNTLQNRRRHFRLTLTSFSYYKYEGGPKIAGIGTEFLGEVKEVGKYKFRLHFSEGGEIGRKRGKTSLLLLAPSTSVRTKWVQALRTRTTPARRAGETLLVEGYLTKVQPLGTSNTRRWFVCDTNSLSYYKREEGSVYGAVVLSNITGFKSTNDKREFRIQASVPITRTGYSEITCRAATQEARDKWVAMLQRRLPISLFDSTLQLCCYIDQ